MGPGGVLIIETHLYKISPKFIEVNQCSHVQVVRFRNNLKREGLRGMER